MSEHTAGPWKRTRSQLVEIIDHEKRLNHRLHKSNTKLLAALESIAEHGDKGSREVARAAIAEAKEEQR